MKCSWFPKLVLGAVAGCLLLAACHRVFAKPSAGTGGWATGVGEAQTVPAPLPWPYRLRAAGNLEPRLSDFAWLEGKWQGNWGPRLAEQVWMAPRAGEMLGLFRAVENDKTLVVEMYSLLETAEGIELRLRHFTASLAPWEQSSTTVLRLASVDLEKAVFENVLAGQPSRQVLIRVDADNYISRSEITSGNDNQQVTEIRFRKQNSAVEGASGQKKKKANSKPTGRAN
jgi:hypothetical protein